MTPIESIDNTNFVSSLHCVSIALVTVIDFLFKNTVDLVVYNPEVEHVHVCQNGPDWSGFPGMISEKLLFWTPTKATCTDPRGQRSG